MITPKELVNRIPAEYGAQISGDKVALRECPLCGHVTEHISKKATSFIFTETGVGFKCFYCNNLEERGASFKALRAMGLGDLCDVITDGKGQAIKKEAYYVSEIVPLEERKVKEFEIIGKADEAYKYLESRKLQDYSSLFLKKGNDLVYPCIYDGFIYNARFRALPQSGEKKIWTIKTTKANNYFSIFKCSDIDVSEPIYVFEGPEDAISSGKRNSVAIFGTDFQKAIRWFDGSQIVFCFDNDETGRKIASEIYEKFPGEYFYLVYDDEFGYKDFNDRLKNGYSFEANSSYIDRHIVRNPKKFYERA